MGVLILNTFCLVADFSFKLNMWTKINRLKKNELMFAICRYYFKQNTGFSFAYLKEAVNKDAKTFSKGSWSQGGYYFCALDLFILC